jgi:hypothetical protein
MAIFLSSILYLNHFHSPIKMSISNIPLFMAFCVSLISLHAQTAERGLIKTEPKASLNVLNVKVEKGNFTFQSSGTNGEGKYAVQSNPEQPIHLHSSERMVNGTQSEKNYHFCSQVHDNETDDLDGASKKSVGQANNMKSACMFQADPSAHTNLNVNVGTGSAKLNLSDMTLDNVTLKGGYTDIWVDFGKPNRVSMKKMDVKNTMGKITLRNTEKAHADVMNIQSDMGEIKLVLGMSETGKDNYVIKSIRGQSLVMLPQNQPLKIIIKGTVLVGKKMPENYTHLDANTYANPAYVKSGGANAITITFDSDAGSLEVMEQ